jgi:nucleotide-binding universal stress UspA family protein
MAVSLARRFEAALEIVHVHAVIWHEYGEGGLYDGLVDRELRVGMQAYLDGVIKLLSDATKLSLSSVLLDGRPAGTITRHAMEFGADLIVMTTLGRGAVARFFLGSVSDALVVNRPSRCCLCGRRSRNLL